MPDDLSRDVCDCRQVTYRRTFNRPTGLGTGDRVWLLIDQFSGDSIKVMINDIQIHAAEGTHLARVELTSHLEPTNRLVVGLSGSPASPAVLSGAVSLQIEST
ncbi:MAG: hypothetical protein KDB00_12590 [Planctomycetales bacterium]|nr:hypothetical protein [Planctomycetales bacterium]